MTKRFPCPVKGCKVRAYSEAGLLGHLYEFHRKAEIIKALLDLLREGGNAYETT